MSIIEGVIHIVRTHKGEGRVQAKCVRLRTKGEGKVSRLRTYAKNFFFFGTTKSQNFSFVVQKKHNSGVFVYFNIRILNCLYTASETFIIFEQNTILPFKYVSKMFLKSSLLISSVQFLISKRI